MRCPSTPLPVLLFCCLGVLPRAFSQAGNKQTPLIDTASRAQAFAPGVVSTPYTEWATSFTPDSKTVYFSQGGLYWTIVSSTFTGGSWSKPVVAAFSGRWRDTDPFVSPDGKKIFFISNRPLENDPQDKPRAVFQIWCADQVPGDQWGTPYHLPSPVNLDSVSNYAPSIDRKGTLYFCSRDREGHSGMASYSADGKVGGFEKPLLLALNGSEDTQDPFIDPDDRYTIFCSGNDIFISYAVNGKWSPAEKLSKQVNNGDGNSSPYVSRDRKTLYYSSGRVQGFYKRDPQHHALNYDELTREMQSVFNASTNILMIPINLPQG